MVDPRTKLKLAIVGWLIAMLVAGLWLVSTANAGPIGPRGSGVSSFSRTTILSRQPAVDRTQTGTGTGSGAQTMREWYAATYNKTAVPVASHSTSLAAAPSGDCTYAWYSAVIDGQGRVICVPTRCQKFGIYNPNTNSWSMGLELPSVDWRGGGAVALSNGTICMTPGNTTTVGLYDPANDVMIPSGVTLQSGIHWHGGGAQLDDGRVVFAPGSNVAKVGIYDPVAQSYAQSNEACSTTNDPFSSSILLFDGRVCFAPKNHDKVGLYDPVTNTYSDGPSASQNGFWGAVLVPSGKVIFVPYWNNRVGIFDPETNSFSLGPTVDGPWDRFRGGVLLPSGRVLLIPYCAGNFNIYDPVANTVERGPARGDDYFLCAAAIENGKVFCVNEWDLGVPVIYDSHETGISLSDLRKPWVARYP